MILQRKKYTALNTIAWVITQRQCSLDIIINYKFYEHHHHHPPRLAIRITLISNLSYQKTSINKNICEYNNPFINGKIQTKKVQPYVVEELGDFINKSTSILYFNFTKC